MIKKSIRERKCGIRSSCFRSTMYWTLRFSIFQHIGPRSCLNQTCFLSISAENPELSKVPACKLEVDQYIALHASPTARDSAFCLWGPVGWTSLCVPPLQTNWPWSWPVILSFTLWFDYLIVFRPNITWTSLPIPELPKPELPMKAFRRKDWKRICAESSLMSLRRPNSVKGLN